MSNVSHYYEISVFLNSGNILQEKKTVNTVLNRTYATLCEQMDREPFSIDVNTITSVKISEQCQALTVHATHHKEMAKYYCRQFLQAGICSMYFKNEAGGKRHGPQIEKDSKQS